MDNGPGNARRANSFSRSWTLVSATLLCAVALLLASCSQETGGNTNSGGGSSSQATAGAGTTTEGVAMGGTTMGATTTTGTTGGTTMGTTTGGTTVAGTTGGTMMQGGTTMRGTTSGGTTMGGTAMGGAITSVRSIASETDKLSLVGRQVNLNGVEVRSSVGDNGFLVGTSGADQLFVVPAGTTNVQQGQTATVEGTLEEIPSVSEAQDQFGLSETEAALLQSQVVYLSANQVQ